MVFCLLVVLLLLISTILGWNTLYSYSDSVIYLHLKDNSLIQLNFSITADNTHNIIDNDLRTALPSPPTNSTLFLLNLSLFAIHDDNAWSERLSLSKFISNSWVKISLDFSSIAGDVSYYDFPTIMTIPSNKNLAYIYGGISSTNNNITDRLLSIDISTMKVTKISTATKPAPFYGASNVLAPNPKTQLVIGGKSQTGWLNMYQLASWDFASGWSVFEVDKLGDQTINSRIFPLTLPIFKPLQNNSIEAISNYLEIPQILLIGGEDDNKQDASPSFAKLDMSTNNWFYNSSISIDINKDEILGAAMIFNTLVVVNTTGQVDNSYQLNLYDVDTFIPVKSLQKNLEAIHSSLRGRKKKPVLLKALLGTLIPLIVILIAGLIGYACYKNRHKSAEEDFVDYQLGAFENESEFSFNTLKPRNLKPYDETASNFEAASFDSWQKKRQLFEKDRLGDSNETLNEQTTTFHGPQKLSGPHPKLQLLPGGPRLDKNEKPLPVSPKLRHTKSGDVIRNGTFKYDDQPVESPFYDDTSVDITNFDAGSDSDIDERMDVQFLVSSKRRSILKVVNPDLGKINENENDRLIEEDESRDDGTFKEVNLNEEESVKDDDSMKREIRQRIPSGRRSFESS